MRGSGREQREGRREEIDCEMWIYDMEIDVDVAMDMDVQNCLPGLQQEVVSNRRAGAYCGVQVHRHAVPGRSDEDDVSECPYGGRREDSFVDGDVAPAMRTSTQY